MIENETKLRVLAGHEIPLSLPKVFITLLAFQRIKCFVDICQYEINGLGTVERQGNKFFIEDIFLIEQRVSPGRVVTDPKALNRFIHELVVSGGDPSKIKFQWHSHADVGVFFSLEDVDTIGGYMNDYMISLVMNKRGDYRCRLDLFKPFYLPLEVPLLVKLPRLEANLARQCQEEMRQKVRTFLFGRGIRTDVGRGEEVSVDIQDIVEEGGDKLDEFPKAT